MVHDNNEHWRGFTQIDASFCLELNVFESGCSYILQHFTGNFFYLVPGSLNLTGKVVISLALEVQFGESMFREFTTLALPS